MAKEVQKQPENKPAAKNAKSASAEDILNQAAGISEKEAEALLSKSPGLSVNMSKIKDTLLNFIVPLISLGVTVVLGIVIIYPTAKALPQTKEELAAKQEKKLVLEKKVKDLHKLVDFKNVVDENSALVNRVLESESKVPYLLNQVDRIARNSGLSVVKLSYSYGSTSDEDTGVDYQTVDVSLGVSGSYAQTVSFLKSVENAARVIDVADIRFSVATSGEEAGLLSSIFSLTSPYLFVESNAITDDPVGIDITSNEFVDFINLLKSLTYYDISANELVVPVIEETEEETEEGAETAETDTEEVVTEETTDVGEGSETPEGSVPVGG
jgi:Tfp pilus assembly protein PilO